MGLSENAVPLNPLNNHHVPFKQSPGAAHFQTASFWSSAEPTHWGGAARTTDLKKPRMTTDDPPSMEKNNINLGRKQTKSHGNDQDTSPSEGNPKLVSVLGSIFDRFKSRLPR